MGNGWIPMEMMLVEDEDEEGQGGGVGRGNLKDPRTCDFSRPIEYTCRL